MFSESNSKFRVLLFIKVFLTLFVQETSSRWERFAMCRLSMSIYSSIETEEMEMLIKNALNDPKRKRFKRACEGFTAPKAKKVDIETYPYMAQIHVKTGVVQKDCSGVIITVLHILTATTCFLECGKWADASMVKVRIGSDTCCGGQFVRIYGIYVNREYMTSVTVDLAVIELRCELHLCKKVGIAILIDPIDYPNFNQSQTLKQVGFNDGCTLTKTESITTIGSYNTCVTLNPHFNVKNRACSCGSSGDTNGILKPSLGSPLILDGKVWAITSYGIDLCSANSRCKGALYERVDALRNFIDAAVYVSGRYGRQKTYLCPQTTPRLPQKVDTCGGCKVVYTPENTGRIYRVDDETGSESDFSCCGLQYHLLFQIYIHIIQLLTLFILI